MKNYLGTYPATVVDVHDPMRSGRIKVSYKPLYGADVSPWCLPKHAGHLWSVPLEGSKVWITLRNGDVRYPVWEGAYTTFNLDASPSEFSDLSEGPYKADLRDAVDHTSPYDVSDHKKGHDHGAGEYWNPYWHGLKFPMGAGLGVNEEPGEQSLLLTDRIGQFLEFVGDPVAPLDPHDETRIGGPFDAPDLDDGNTLFSDEGLKARTTLRARHGQKLEFTVAAADKEEEMTLQSLNIGEAEGSRLAFSNSLLDMNLKLERFVPGHFQAYESKIDPLALVPSHWQKLYDNHGQQWMINSDPDTPNRWVKTQNGLGDFHTIEWDNRLMEWADHNGQSIYYNTDERIPLRYIEMKNSPGESIRLDHDLKAITIVDRLGNQILFDGTADEIVVSHHTGESVTLNASGITVNSIAGVTVASAANVAITNASPVTVNGRKVALDGDPVSTPAGPGVVNGTGQ